MTARAETQSFALEYDLPHPPAKVWRALTEPKLLAEWLMATDMRPVVGKSFTFKSDPTPWWDGIVNCEVVAVDPPKRLSYTWRSGAGPSALDTVVTWTLSPTPSGGTHLALEQSGFLPTGKFALDGMSKGWTRMVTESLPKVLAETT